MGGGVSSRPVPLLGLVGLEGAFHLTHSSSNFSQGISKTDSPEPFVFGPGNFCLRSLFSFWMGVGGLNVWLSRTYLGSTPQPSKPPKGKLIIGSTSPTSPPGNRGLDKTDMGSTPKGLPGPSKCLHNWVIPTQNTQDNQVPEPFKPPT